MKSIIVSVIIPVYNMESYLCRCLDSVLSCNYTDFEIICVNDGSTDRSLQILEEYAARDSRIRIIDQPNAGPSSARNSALKAASGEFVSFLDSDDYLHPQFFEIMTAVQNADNADLIVCGHCGVPVDAPHPRHHHYDNYQIETTKAEKAYQNHKLRSYVWGKLYRTSMAKQISFHETIAFAEDQIYNADFFEIFPEARVSIISAQLYYYCDRPGSLAKVSEEKLLRMAEYFLDRSKKATRYADCYLSMGIRYALKARYLSGHIHFSFALFKQSWSALRGTTAKLIKAKNLSIKERFVWLVFIYAPDLYWIHIVRGSEGMLKWELVEWKRRLGLR